MKIEKFPEELKIFLWIKFTSESLHKKIAQFPLMEVSKLFNGRKCNVMFSVLSMTDQKSNRLSSAKLFKK